ncbi:sugar kinase [Rhabdaerophilum sp. SD176]|uniref:sugar kinase n=1 Tax=Rhabdaerophilum sp. SD176 TaxID=2983548 RepID=UPI0024DFFA0F|nr:sugar kinase [Rhabdaerophilum sp. SD176]
MSSPAYPAILAILAMGEPMIEFNQVKGGDGRNFLQGFGGDTSNFAIAAARQGASVGYVSALGRDANAGMLRTLWDAEGVDHSLVREHPSAPTGMYFVTHGPNGHEFSFARAGSAASLYGPDDVPAEAIARAKALHLSGISLAISNSACDAAYAAIHAARAAGCLVSFDTNLRLKLWSKDRARAIMTDVIGLSDLVLPSYDDIVAITGLTDPDALADWCLARGAKLVALKLGAEGALVADARARHRVPPHRCTPIDATGAGDCFGGAFVARLVAGDSPAEAARYAGVAAALSTEGYGAVAPIPDAATVRQAMG